ncbi:MAG: metallophosphoesterase [Tannerellaceae bacterium]|nr:metallophosphoesterase [Tannerellaceae bacterium]
MKASYSIFICLWIITLSLSAQKQAELVILHTNDTHSQIEPLSASDMHAPNQGGLVNRKAVIDSVRAIHPHVLLLDAGDFVQGTPYYNLFKGRAEVAGINLLGYEAVTLGNHEFDYGLDTLQVVLQELDCPVVCCNYDFTGTPLEGMTVPYLVVRKGKVKTGIIGVGIDPEGLIQKDKYEGMGFLPPVETVNYYADLLRKKMKCDVIICLSHLGYQPDLTLAGQSTEIDVIIGGHSHTFLEGLTRQHNAQGREVIVYQAGGRGSQIGEVKIQLAKGRNR